MLRKIVVINKHEWLAAGWSNRQFAPAAMELESKIKVKGVEFDDRIHPVPTFRPAGVAAASAGIHYGGTEASRTPPHEAYAVAATFEDEEAVSRLRRDRAGEVTGVFSNPTIGGCPRAYCQTAPHGTFMDARQQLNVAALRRRKLTGRKVRVAVVDTGINGRHPGPDGKPLSRALDLREGYSPLPGYVAGSSDVDHGTMVAFNVLLAAPDARLLDYALLQSVQGSWSGFLSDALAAFADLIDLLRRKPGPLVVNNSWGLFDRSSDAALRSPENYSANPDHPFNQITGALVAAGADVVFAAGNCGADCPDGRCGGGDVGPGSSIHGANSHPSVITIAAVTVSGKRLGYSSQGPGGLTPRKPDFAAYSHFDGSGVYRADGGTSTAAPVASGLVAALRQGWPKVPPAVLRSALQRSLSGPRATWSYDLGYGILEAGSAMTALGSVQGPQRAPRPKLAKAHGEAWMLERKSLEELAASRTKLEKATPKAKAAKRGSGGRGRGARRSKSPKPGK